MFVKDGARDLLLKGEREKFLADQWPRIRATIQRLGLKPEELLKAATPPLAYSEKSPDAMRMHRSTRSPQVFRRDARA